MYDVRRTFEQRSPYHGAGKVWQLAWRCASGPRYARGVPSQGDHVPILPRKMAHKVAADKARRTCHDDGLPHRLPCCGGFVT
jgi:hypothetical protein